MSHGHQQLNMEQVDALPSKTRHYIHKLNYYKSTIVAINNIQLCHEEVTRRRNHH